MRYVDLSLINPNDPDVKEWIKKANNRKRTLKGKATHKERVEYLKRVNIWREFKPILEKYYGKKCWYSECDLTGSFGDVDHFRPKSKSTNMDGTVILEEGYWWLAYDYTNYRLSCEVCNRSYEKGGKNDRFPLKEGTMPAQAPSKNDTPVLLDPCNKEDSELIDCDESGKIVPLSKDEYDVFRVSVSADIYTVKIDGNDIILIYVHEAPENMKPVYINGNMDNTYIRTGDGDRKATPDELNAFLRNAHPGQDNLAADKFTMEDLDADSVLDFKARVNKRYPKQKYMEMPNEQFLTEIGAAFRDRDTGRWLLKKGTLLFLGKVNAIKELFPQYHVDYFNRRGHNARWIDRVTDDEPSGYEMNLYNFFTIVYEKMRTMLQEAFVLDSKQLRIPTSDFDETLRECIVNCLAHADYVQGYPSIKIEAFDGWFHFVNPGKMLVTKEQFKTGGDSRPRNEVIMKMFRLLGASERQGFGGPLIFKSAMENQFRSPEIETDIEHTELKVWNIDLADSYPNLSEIEKNILRILMKAPTPLSVKSVVELSDETDYQVRKAIASLVELKLLDKIGNGPSTKYTVATGTSEMLTKLQLMLDSFRKVLSER